VTPTLPLTLLSEPLAICRLAADAPIPAWIRDARQFLSLSRSPEELSIVADERAVPGGLEARRGYRALRVDGPLPLDLVGIVAALAAPLAAAHIPIFPVATYDTDYLLVFGEQLERAIAVLEGAGHRVARGGV
jgi:hypothetical protein